MGIIVIGASSGAGQDVDATPKAARGILYDANGNILTPIDRAAITPGSQGGILLAGADYKRSRLIRASSFGTLRTSDDTQFLYDSIEGAAVDTNKWIQSTTTMTITQAAASGTLFNAGSSSAATVGAMHTSHRRLPLILGTPFTFRCRARHTAHFNNNLIEMGFGSPASATAASIGDGAIWRKDATGQYLPVISINGAEILGTPISNATFLASVPATDYAIFEVMLEATRARCNIYTQAGVLVTSQDLDWTGISAGLAVTHLQALVRTYNSGATGTAVQLFVHGVSVVGLDTMSQRDYRIAQSGMNFNSLTSPTAYTQLANYANSAAPASATLSNTAAGYTTLGGQFQWAAVAGAETDYALFGFTNPSPFTFYFTGVRISTWNMGAAAAATPTLLQWGLAFNSSAVSLATGAPYSPMRVALGNQQLVASAAIGVKFDPDVVWSPQTPLAVQPGRFLHVILKSLVSAATASEIIRGVCAIDGFFE